MLEPFIQTLWGPVHVDVAFAMFPGTHDVFVFGGKTPQENVEADVKSLKAKALATSKVDDDVTPQPSRSTVTSGDMRG